MLCQTVLRTPISPQHRPWTDLPHKFFQTKTCKSQARHKFDVAYAKKMRELVSEGVLEYHPLNESKIVLVDMYQSKEMKESKQDSKKAFLSVAPNVSFDSFLDDVVKVQKVVKA